MGQTIMVVDDQLYVTHLLSHVLHREGYAVRAAVNGVEALRDMATHQPDLVITDLMMPEMDGFALIETLRADPRWADLPIVVLTAQGRERDHQRALDLGAQDFVTKPFRARDIIQMVQRYLPEG